MEQTTQTILSRYGNTIEEESQKVSSSISARKAYNPFIWGGVGAITGWFFGHTWIWALGGAVITLLLMAIVRPRKYTNTTLSEDIADETVILCAKKYFDNPHFDRYKGMSETEFGTLFDEEADDYWSDCTLKGSYHGLGFRICNVEATYEEEEENDYTDSDGNTQTETTTKTVEIFKGSILRITVPEYFDHTVRVGAFRSKEHMDHQAFNARYGVSCRDRVYARYVLTQSFMDKLVHLADGFNRAPEIRFTGKNIYVLLGMKQELEGISFLAPQSSIERIIKEVTFSAWMLETIDFHNHHIINNSTKKTDYRKNPETAEVSNEV